MEHVRKFVLVPPELYSKLKKDNLSAIDKQMHEILFDTELCDSEKWKKYSQALQRYLHFFNEDSKDIELEIIEKPSGTIKKEEKKDSKRSDVHRSALNELPQEFVAKGEKLYDLVKLCKVFEWTSEGEVYINNRKLVGSNIVDLIASCVGAEPSEPIGKFAFQRHLQASVIPKKFYVQNIALQNLIEPQPSTSAVSRRAARNPLLREEEEQELQEQIQQQQQRVDESLGTLAIRATRASSRNRRKFQPYQHHWEKYKF